MRPVIVLLILALSVIFAMVLIGCKGLDEEHAKAAALEFLNSRVKFYSSGSGYGDGYNQYEFSFRNNTLSEGKWRFLVEISNSGLNQTKKAIVRLEVDSKTGKIVGFEQIRQEESFK